MSRLQSLLASLPKPFSKDPQGVAALTVAYNTGGNFVVDTGVLRTVVNGTALVITLANRTMLDVANLIGGTAGYSAAVGSGLNAVSAQALVEGQYISVGGQSVAIPYFTSGTYRVLAPIGRALDDLDAAAAEGLRQLNLTQTSGVWLDRIGALYGLTRNTGEPDLLFSRRIVQSVISVKCNGKSLILILQKALGLTTATVTDGAAAHFTVTVEFDWTATFTYDTTTINTLLLAYKAFGTVLDSLSFKASAVDVYNTAGITDSFSTGVATGSGEFGQPEFGQRDFGN